MSKSATTSPAALERPVNPRLSLLIDAREAATLADVGVSTWHRLVAMKKAPACLKVGGSTKWRRADVVAWVEAGCPARQD